MADKTIYEIREAAFGWVVLKNGRDLFHPHPPMIASSTSAYRLAREDAEQNRPAEILTIEDGMTDREELA